MSTGRRRLSVFMLLIPVLLAACRSVPDVTQVAVPSGAPILHGSYRGQLQEELWFEDAVLSTDGKHLYVVASASAHSVLLDLDPVTGQEVRRVTVPVSGPKGIAERADGKLVLAGWEGSGVIEPAQLTMTQKLPAAERVSDDGQLLLAPVPTAQNVYIRYRTDTGQEISRYHPAEYDNRVSDDLNWLAPASGKTVVNLNTGATINVEDGHLDPCHRRTQAWPPRLLSIEAAPGGFFIAYGDGTLEWRDTAGQIQQVQTLTLPCPTQSNTDAVSDMNTSTTGTRILFYARGWQANRSVTLFGEASPTQTPAIRLNSPQTTTDSSNWFEGMFAYRDAVTPLLRGNELLERWTVWKQPIANARFPVTLQAIATYRNQETYAVQGTMQTPAGTLNFSGEGKVSQGSDGPKIYLTPQAICGDLIAPPCPTLAWHVKLSDQSGEAGSMNSYGDTPLTGPKAEQRGRAQFRWNGESRSFSFSLLPIP